MGLAFSFYFGIIAVLRPTGCSIDAEWCNGSTADSDSVSRGSNPFSVAGNLRKEQIPLFIGVWLSLVERYVRDVEVAGSNPVTPIFLCPFLAW